jgi:putative DNA primase/helicase
MDIKESVKGRWPGILHNLGINIGNGKHCPCPQCGGKDRFRFDNKDGSGSWICNQCGAGDGWALVMSVLKIDFAEAVKVIGKIVGTVDFSKSPEEPKVSKELLRKIYLESEPVNGKCLVSQYLNNRGISIRSSKLRFHKSLFEPETHHRYPAMLATFLDKDSTALTIHRTYLTQTGEKAEIENPKKILPSLKKMSGGAVRLFDPDEQGMIGIAEGIETALACTELFEIPTWAATTAGLMEQFQVPKEVKSVVIYGDNDMTYTGQKAAYTLANRLRVRDNIPCEVRISTGKDFLEDLIRHKTI